MIVERRALSLAAVIAVVLLIAGQGRPRAAAAALGVSGGDFTVGGRPQFLFIVSMFDALREAGRGTGSGSALDGDFRYLKEIVHADGVRVMPNWWTAGDGRTPRFSLDSLFDPDRARGNWARSGQLQPMHDLLTAAAARGLVVDVTFTRETMRTRAGAFMSEADYTRSAVAAIHALASHGNVMFDVQNEYSCAHLHGVPRAGVLSPRTIAAIRRGAPAPDIVTASPCSDAAGAGRVTRDLGLSAVAYHNRGTGWTTDRVMASEIAAMRVTTKAPIYYQEPQKFEDDPDAAGFAAAARAARLHGAAAWTFHTSAGYDLTDPGVTFQGRLRAARTSAALERIRAAIDTAAPASTRTAR